MIFSETTECYICGPKRLDRRIIFRFYIGGSSRVDVTAKLQFVGKAMKNRNLLPKVDFLRKFASRCTLRKCCPFLWLSYMRCRVRFPVPFRKVGLCTVQRNFIPRYDLKRAAQKDADFLRGALKTNSVCFLFYRQLLQSCFFGDRLHRISHVIVL